MSGKGKRRVPKRPREEEQPPRERPTVTHNFSPINSSAPSFTHPSLSSRPDSSTTSSNVAQGGGALHSGMTSGIMSKAPPGKVAIPALRTPQAFESSQKGNKK